jgi:hypothetical protein
MNDIVMIDLAKQLEREAEHDSFLNEVEIQSQEIQEQYLSDPQHFAEITELLYHDDLHWPIEEKIIRMLIAYRSGKPGFAEAALELTALFNRKLTTFSHNLAMAKVKLARIDD